MDFLLRTLPELSIRGAGRKDRSCGDENVRDLVLGPVVSNCAKDLQIPQEFHSFTSFRGRRDFSCNNDRDKQAEQNWRTKKKNKKSKEKIW